MATVLCSDDILYSNLFHDKNISCSFCAIEDMKQKTMKRIFLIPPHCTFKMLYCITIDKTIFESYFISCLKLKIGKIDDEIENLVLQFSLHFLSRKKKIQDTILEQKKVNFKQVINAQFR